ncbi:hypothetical protein TNCV_3826681 [Trichonephila clavipes]|nr:hypothetical protein TNCV_3826681 [Trichonephila clavipes]
MAWPNLALAPLKLTINQPNNKCLCVKRVWPMRRRVNLTSVLRMGITGHFWWRIIRVGYMRFGGDFPLYWLGCLMVQLVGSWSVDRAEIAAVEGPGIVFDGVPVEHLTLVSLLVWSFGYESVFAALRLGSSWDLSAWRSSVVDL